MLKKLILIILIGVLIMSCSPNEVFENSITNENEVVAVISTNKGDIILEFYPDIAPKHVESFMTHAENGYYDGTTFHRVIPEFMIQGGDPNSKNEDRRMHGMGGNAGEYYGIGDENNSESWMLPENSVRNRMIEEYYRWQGHKIPIVPEVNFLFVLLMLIF